MTTDPPAWPPRAASRSIDRTTARRVIEERVEARLEFRDDDSPGDLRERASAEHNLRDEYAGRFLIELLQNARDAQLASPTPSGAEVVYVHLALEPSEVHGRGD
jgi:hypothetical protein